jgi:hypothetical protein
LWVVVAVICCVDQCFGGTYCLQTAAICSCWFLALGFFYPEDGGDTFIRNIGSHKNYTAPHPRKRRSSRVKFVQLVKAGFNRIDISCFSAWCTHYFPIFMSL